MQENILAVVGPTTIDGPPVERKQERKVRGIGEGAANQRVRCIRCCLPSCCASCGMAMEDDANSTQP